MNFKHTIFDEETRLYAVDFSFKYRYFGISWANHDFHWSWKKR